MATTQTLNPSHDTPELGFLHLPRGPMNRSPWGKEIGDFLTLGRDILNQISINDPAISLRHARIDKTAQGFRLQDLRSRNGTFLNGVRITEAFLRDGDKILLGESMITFSRCRNLNDRPEHLTSKNAEWARSLSLIPNMARSDCSILILGPSGSGKDVMAQVIHEQSSRREGPFVSVNCSALSEALIESELFGHVKGAFTGASFDRKGAFEAARGGTLFLDEVGDLPLSLQPKLLRALENGEIKSVGSDRNVKTDVRVIAATHSNLKERVVRGEFRLDLFFRLNVLQLKTLSLFQRMEDFEDLLAHFSKMERVSFFLPAIAALKKHRWPGNVRELRNVVARARAFFGTQVRTEDQVQILLDQPLPKSSKLEDFSLKIEEENQAAKSSAIRGIEYEMIKKSLIANGGNQRQTALELGMPKSTLHDRLKLYGIKVEKIKTEF